MANFAPAVKQAGELGITSRDDPFVAVPVWVLEVEDNHVEYFAMIDRIAKDSFSWETVSITVGASKMYTKRFTWSAKDHRILRVFFAQLLNSFVHWDKPSINQSR